MNVDELTVKELWANSFGYLQDEGKKMSSFLLCSDGQTLIHEGAPLSAKK